ncbi:EthD domain-containing protein [Parafrankia sp. BMG5.11]|uniref:EthD domain-containing protein n=1 Tax=Parafrankia sp. BMG5.11 TaxID=222540 RepID=UPI0014049D29|nr:EthD domain-containing protein [Parafrankia sp. BMG5.11]
MMKSVCILARKAGSGRTAFHDYYETSHAPLAIGHFPFARYVRNHLVGSVEPGFDTISEFWAADIGKVAALMDGPAGEIMRADEERFMDRSRIAAAGAEERLLSDQGPATDGLRRAVFVDWRGDGAGEKERTIDLARSLAARGRAVSLDLIQPWGEPAFPARAIIWTTGDPLAELPPLPQAREFVVRSIETSAPLLSA